MLNIPCFHATASALREGVNVETLVANVYRAEFLKGAYEGHINPPTDYDAVSKLAGEFSELRLLPPSTRCPPGRPRKQRFFSRGEVRVSVVFI